MQTDPSFFNRSKTKLESVWNVRPSGDYEQDCKFGHSLAQEFLTYRNSALLGQIVRQMPVEHTGIEIGFLSAISQAALA
jgi:hypothetical protein